ncbi:MAG: RNA methyltransferase [Mangrovibacterium sp.]
MLSKNKIKFIQSLNRKKIRERENVFLVEGNKMVREAIHSELHIDLLCGTAEFLESNHISGQSAREVIEVTSEELQKASLLQSPQKALAIIQMPADPFSMSMLLNEFSLALDFIQDPGNLGTIIRIADWFGIRHLLCSENTVDCYNPKVIQSSMGSIFRVKVHYLNLKATLAEANKHEIPVSGTFLDGDNIFATSLPPYGILVMGNEGNGISPELDPIIRKKIQIPSFPLNQQGSESLNVATATAICCAEFRRRVINS